MNDCSPPNVYRINMEKRTFIPGSEWVYFKIYTGTKTADTILKNVVYCYCQEMMNKKVIDKWFFIRYTDPDFHIRLRLHLNEARDFSCIFNRFFIFLQPFIDADLMWNIQCDTYQREMERYGEYSISLIEDLFFIDSDFIIRLLQKLNKENPEQLRWKLALVLIDSFLLAFDMELPQRRELLNTMADSYKREFGFIHHHTTKQLNDKYRTCRKDIESALLRENIFAEMMDVIQSRMLAVSPISNKLNLMHEKGELQMPRDLLLTSLIHMTMNRWFRAQNRLHEMIIYEFLSRYYASEMAKKSITLKKQTYEIS